jgi:hypothetical protein
MGMGIKVFTCALWLSLVWWLPSLSAQTVLTMQASEVSTKLGVKGSLISAWLPSLRISWKAEGEVSYKNTDLPYAFIEPQLGIDCSTDLGTLIVGDIAGDQRYATIFSMKLGTPLITTKKLGPPSFTSAAYSVVPLHKWAYVFPLREESWIHAYGLYSGIGALVEQPTALGILRFSSLWLNDAKKTFLKPIIDYGALPIGEGCVNYLAWTGNMLSIMKQFTCELHLMFRWAYDAAFGFGMSTALRVKCEIFGVACTYSRRQMPSWAGSVAELAYTTSDAPLSRDIVSVSYRHHSISVSASLSDTWWRITHFAGDSQRRQIQLKGECSFMLPRDYTVTAAGSSQWRWNRSGSRSTTIRTALIIDGKVGKVVVSAQPFVRWGSSTTYGGTLHIGYPYRLHDTIGIELSIEGFSAEVTYTVTRNFAHGGVFHMSLMHDGAINLRYSIAL